MVERAGVNQWQLVQALSILALLDEITDEAIITYTPGDASENVFLLFETALRGDAKEVRRMITALKYQQEPHMLLGLLSSQALSLAAVITASGTDDNPEKDFAIHPFVAKKMRYYTKKINQKDLAAIIEVFALADSSLKRSKAEPWLLIEQALFKVAKIVKS